MKSWFDRHLLVAASFALGIGATGQLLVHWLARGEMDATIGQRIAAVAYTLLFWLAVSQLVAIAGCRLLHRRSGRLAALGLSSIVLGALSIICAAGLALRIISGSYLTAGALAFSLNSSDHFLHGASTGYTGWFTILGLVTVGFGVGVVLALRSAAGDPCWPERRHGIVLCVMLFLLVLVYARRGESRFTKGMFVSEPLLAFVSSFSMDTNFELTRTTHRPGALGEPMAPPGPPRAAEAKWRAQIAAAGASGEAERPNVILVMLESVAPRFMSSYGYHRKTTPTVDAIAAQGLHMRRAWTTATHSNYAQMAVLSALFPRRVRGLDQYKRLDYPRFLFHDTFHALGYDTATISSQDENWQGMKRFQTTSTPTFFWNSEDFTGPHLDSGVEKIVPDDATTDKIIEWLNTPRDKPWAIYVNFQGPHFPYTISPNAPRPWLPDMPTWSTFGYLGFPEGEKDIVVNRYDNAILHVDDQIRRLRDHLAETGVLDNTLWVITSDHGEMFFERGLVTHGKSLNEIEARVPIILTWPGHIEPEERLEPVSHIDILPTVADYLGIPPHPSWQGRSFRKPDPEGVGRHAIFLNIQGLRFADAIVCWPWKLIVDRTGDKPYLYNLDNDPDERTNLIEAQPEIATRLNNTLSKQLIAQLDYHRYGQPEERDARFQPRLRPCPRLE